MPKHKLFIENTSKITSPGSSPKSIATPKSCRENDSHGTDTSGKNSKSTVISKSIKTNDSNSDDPDELTDVNSDSDDSIKIKFFGLQQKLPYTMKEDEEILKYVLKSQNIFRTKSISLWKFLESKKKSPPRTYQSLKNRFLRNIKPNLFTTFRHMIKDEDVKNILLKFPELKRDLNKKSTIDKTKLVNRNYMLPSKSKVPRTVSSNCESSEDNITEDNQNLIIARRSPLSITQSSEADNLIDNNLHRKVEEQNGKIVVTFKNYTGEISQNINFVGIYEKYLKLKTKNFNEVCPMCGEKKQLLIDIADESSESNCNSNSDGLIVNSYDVNQWKERDSVTTNKTPSLCKKICEKGKVEKSPSLLESIESENNVFKGDDRIYTRAEKKKMNLKAAKLQPKLDVCPLNAEEGTSLSKSNTLCNNRISHSSAFDGTTAHQQTLLNNLMTMLYESSQGLIDE